MPLHLDTSPRLAGTWKLHSADCATAADQADAATLPAALASGQSAYQSLLKLRANEFAVNAASAGQQPPGSSSGSASGPGSRAQRQLEQLELSADQNRYETESRALSSREQAQSAGQEIREALDRLRELARRQQDLNDRVRELQSALQAAESEQDREEIERELKRLREQQRELLRDADQLEDDLTNRNDSSQPQQLQQQLDETRQHIQQASESLNEGRLSEALTEGTRAGRELEQLADDMRRQTADQFDEQMSELRENARQIEERQQQLSDLLAEQQAERRRSLRDEERREALQQGLAQQQREVEELLEEMQQLVQDAEQPEPVLARQLHDAILQAHEDNIEPALEMAEDLVQFGANQQASEALREAGPGARRLREGVERAAESILGDEAEALRRAQQELDDLSEQLRDEINQALADQPSEDGPSSEAGQSTNAPPGNAQQEGAQPSREGQQPNRQQANGTPMNQDPGGGRPQGPDQADQQPASRRATESSSGSSPRSLLDELFEDLADAGGPITGDQYRAWDDALRNVEDLLQDSDLRTEAARIRDRAQAARAEYKRRSKEPNWSELLKTVAEPLDELRSRIGDEIRRRASPDELSPIERDEAPAEFEQRVRRYYERLGGGQ